MDRKDFLKTVAAAGVAAAVPLESNNAVFAEKSSADSLPCDLVAVLGGEPAAMFQAGIKEFGGMGKFVKKGQKIAIKPNIAWDKTPELAANTNPELIAEIVRQCLEAGAAEVAVFDHTCDEWRKAYKNSGIEKAAHDAGAKMIPANEESYYREISLPKAKNLKTALVHNALFVCDAWINVPVLKCHGGARMTIAMKNLMGIVWDRQAFHRNNLNQCIADICTLEKPPILNVVDAYRVVKSNGPRGRSESDVATPKGLFLSPDIVAVDTAATKFFSQIEKIAIDDVGHLALGESLGLGTTDLDSIRVKRVKM